MTFIERKVLFIIKSNEDIYKFIFILSKIWDPKLLLKKKTFINWTNWNR